MTQKYISFLKEESGGGRLTTTELKLIMPIIWEMENNVCAAV